MQETTGHLIVWRTVLARMRAAPAGRRVHNSTMLQALQAAAERRADQAVRRLKEGSTA